MPLLSVTTASLSELILNLANVLNGLSETIVTRSYKKLKTSFYLE